MGEISGNSGVLDALAADDGPVSDRPVGVGRVSPLSQKEITALIEEYLPLVNHVVFQVAVHFPRHVEREELARAGALGLVEAAKRYDESRGVPFNRFAAQRIRGAIIDAVRAADWAPRSVRALARRLDQVEQSLATRLGRIPSLGETANELGISRAELDRLRDRLFRSVVLAFDSLSSDSDDEELTVVDILADRTVVEPSTELEARELRAYMRDAVKLLPERHRVIILGYFIEERTSADLARFLGVTESRVSQMRTEALTMLRRGIEAQYDESDDESTGLVARRRANYAAAISDATGWGDRISCGSSDPGEIAGSIHLEEASLEVVGSL
ncbi:MAG: FliA/WhiG family RNA polymerase sigma factor [Microthrixaceae bacterium]